MNFANFPSWNSLSKLGKIALRQYLRECIEIDKGTETVKLNAVSYPHSLSMPLFSPSFSLGVIHKWRHANLDCFLHPLSPSSRFTKALVLLSQNPWHPLPSKAVMSFMDDPLSLPQYPFLLLFLSQVFF